MNLLEAPPLIMWSDDDVDGYQSSAARHERGEDRDSTTIFNSQQSLCCPAEDREPIGRRREKIINAGKKRKSQGSETPHFISQGHCLTSVSRLSRKKNLTKILVKFGN